MIMRAQSSSSMTPVIQAVTEKIFKAVATRRWRSGCGARGVVAWACGAWVFGVCGLVELFSGDVLSGVVLTFITFLGAKIFWALAA